MGGHKMSCSRRGYSQWLPAPPIPGDGPFLLLDVDGPLNAFYMKHSQTSVEAGWRSHTTDNGYNLVVRPDIGPEILSFCAENNIELVWCTMWQNQANEHISPIYGFPDDLPFINFNGGVPEDMGWDVYMKTPHVLSATAGRPFAWLDDEITEADEEYLIEHGAGDHILVHVDPATGITDNEWALVANWLSTIR